jgi:hypothetical protein
MCALFSSRFWSKFAPKRLRIPSLWWLTVAMRSHWCGLQDVLFPDGLHYSPKTKEYRTSNIHLLLEITGCFIDTWNSEKNETRRQNVFGSRVVDILEKRSKLDLMDEPDQIK